MGRIRKAGDSDKSVATKSLTPWSREYFAIIAEIDASYFVVEQIARNLDKRAPIVRMIDKSTGYEGQQIAEIKAIVARIKELQSKLPPDDPHFRKQDQVTGLVASDPNADTDAANPSRKEP